MTLLEEDLSWYLVPRSIKPMGLSLHAWQEQCIASWLEKQGRGVTQVVTGAGKTILALYAAKALQEKLRTKLHIVIIVPKTFLVGQWKSAILAHHDDLGIEREDIGWVCGTHHQEHDKPVMIYVINSARYKLSYILHQQLSNRIPVMLIADECHHYASAENRKIFSFLELLDERQKKNYYSLGLSATPQGNGFEQVLVPSLGPLFYTYGFSEAMTEGIINQVVIYNVALKMTDSQVAKYDELSARITTTLKKLNRLIPGLSKLTGSAFFIELQRLCLSETPSIAETATLLLTLFYQRRALVYEAPQRLSCAFDLIALLDSQSKIIIFGERISQSEALYERLKRYFPNKVAQYHSEMGETEKTLALRRYRTGEARILVSCKALDEGLDIPSADVGILLATTSEQRQRIQRLGRILRLQEGKGKASLFYLSLAHTIEDSELLDAGIDSIQEWYLQYTSHFTHPSYDELADTLLSTLEEKNASTRGLDALLNQGRVRNDWFEDPKALQAKIQAATLPQEKKYYSLMRSLSLLRKKTQSIHVH
jgi:superfamily II DNA or RNA helicase